ncbi:hypothetical protein H5410_046412 [Solanum commersonii]|uniref:Uncharacterized protein n=1 Tax=Solanum commersonii TaxID=4109 RepID=A0A9J5XE60_SOLCO|nr:hypothetical protein H5410_046412 [Solanum commersonii]
MNSSRKEKKWKLARKDKTNNKVQKPKTISHRRKTEHKYNQKIRIMQENQMLLLTLTRRNNGRLKDQDKAKNAQMQVKQIKDNQNQQSMQGTCMNAKPLKNIERESDAQIPKTPLPVIDMDDDHCLNNDTPSPVIPSVVVVADEVCGGRMVVKENPTNMQEGEPKGRGLTQAPATTVKAAEKILNQTQQQILEVNQHVHSITEKHDQSKGSMAKDMGNKACTSGQAEEQNKEQVHNVETVGLNVCKKFIMEEEQQALDVIFLKAKYNFPTPSKPPDKSKPQTT